MKKTSLVIVATTLLVACGSDDPPANNTTQPPAEEPAPTADAGDGVTHTITEPVSPLGTVSGQVLDTDLVPLGGATVDLMVGSQTAARTATVDDKGYFAFPGVPAGSQVLLAFGKAGYATLRATSTVPSSAGNTPLENANASFGPVLLAKLDGSVRFRVALPNAQPAAGALATLRVSPVGSVILSNNDSSTNTLAVVTVTAVADATGLVEFKNVPSPLTLSRYPNAQYQLMISPLDQNGDGIAETGGILQAYTPSGMITAGNLAVVNLPTPQSNGEL